MSLATLPVISKSSMVSVAALSLRMPAPLNTQVLLLTLLWLISAVAPGALCNPPPDLASLPVIVDLPNVRTPVFSMPPPNGKAVTLVAEHPATTDSVSVSCPH